jgi:hypothetical protein
VHHVAFEENFDPFAILGYRKDYSEAIDSCRTAGSDKLPCELREASIDLRLALCPPLREIASFCFLAVNAPKPRSPAPAV